MTNRDRQSDEIEALLSIYGTEEFFRLPDNKLALDVSPRIREDGLDVRYTGVVQKNASQSTYRHFPVKTLPPSCLRFQLPPGYPGEEPPRYDLEISWLPPWECSLVCQRLDELWEENRGCEVMFAWREFLRHDVLDFLGYEQSLDVSFLFAIHQEPNVPANIALLELGDARAKNGALFHHPMHYLTRYDESRRRINLNRETLICEICCLQLSGQKFVEFGNCNHRYCKDCTVEYITTKIKSGKVDRIICPQPNCHCALRGSLIKQLTPNLYSKYEQILLRNTLETMSDVVFCPRKSCQFPVIATPGETLATCASCKYNFCIYCRKVYHGVTPCVMASEDTVKLIDAYHRASRAEKKILITKHGRQQIQSVVEERLTRDYIKENTKPCPECKTPTEKIDGCNKMCCVHCHVNFCWLCGLSITSANKYDHFTSYNDTNACYGRLFEGMVHLENPEPDLN